MHVLWSVYWSCEGDEPVLGRVRMRTLGTHPQVCTLPHCAIAEEGDARVATGTVPAGV
jgi:hypothetical protein